MNFLNGLTSNFLNSINQRDAITWWLIKVDNVENPRYLGKSLTGNKTGLWRYRIGNYRVIADINDDRCIILALEVGHRKEIYK
ncbi:MAG: type II toxin-antitoxin system RelE family toxin [Veillonella sp.]